MSTTIYHNPRCSKSRKTLELIREKGVEPNIVEYLKEPPTAQDLRQILDMLGVGPRDILRKKEAKEAGLDDPSISDDDLIEKMVAAPQVIERPIVIRHAQAVMGRPPENVLSLLD